MSASLVGSEMCIRDRPFRVQVARGLGVTGDRRAASGEMFDEEDGFGFDPVSYTHLTLPTICSV
eukprot:7364284-Alexandrium_andersonii.AAC.1